MDRLSTDVGTAALGDYATRLRRRSWLLVVAVALGLLAGAATLQVQPRTWTSTTAVLVTPVGPAPGATTTSARTSSDVNLDTEAQLVASAQVADAARVLLRTPQAVAALQADVSVTVPPNSSVLSIAFSAATAVGAQQGSHAFAQAYLTNRGATADRQVAVSLSGLQAQLTAAQAQLKDLTDRSASLVANSPDKVYADAQRAVVVSQIGDLSSRIAPLKASPASPGSIITDAPLPASPSSPLPVLDLGGGLVVGLLVGLAAVVALDRRDHSLRSPADVERLVEVPVLAEVDEPVPGEEFPGDSQGRLFDRLRNTLAGQGRGPLVLQVVDTAGTGPTATSALQLARSLVRTRGGAALVLAHPQTRLGTVTGTAGRPGLTELLRGEVGLDEACCTLPSLPGVVVLPAGCEPEQLEGLLQSPRLADVLHALRDRYAVVVETASTADSAAAQAVSGLADQVLLVVPRGGDGRTSRSARDAAVVMGARVAGVALTGDQPVPAPGPEPEVRAGVAELRTATSDAPAPAAAATLPAGPGLDPLTAPLASLLAGTHHVPRPGGAP